MINKIIPNETIKKAKRLLNAGMTQREVSEKLNISKGSVWKISNNMITNDRVLEPKCDNRIDELSMLYNNEKERSRKYLATIENLNIELDIMKEDLKNEKEKNRLLKEYLEQEKYNHFNTKENLKYFKKDIEELKKQNEELKEFLNGSEIKSSNRITQSSPTEEIKPIRLATF